ncbi:MAG TPA: Pycsar system effector family protein [Chitinophagaceae bacterium]|nr:Pycsar system effector family protein [Chitinophagaceae bacterium]
MMDYPLLAKKTQQFINHYFEKNVPHPLPYHNKVHTENVVAAVNKIGNHYQLNEHDFFVVISAAWFHDMGYYTGEARGHEQQGANMADAFLSDHGVDEPTREQVKGCIMATQMPQRPANLLEQIVCDGDLFHLGTDNFIALNKRMRKEMEETKGKSIDKKEWRRGTIILFQTHHFHTDYCRLLLDQKKQENLDRLLKKQQGEDPAPDTLIAPPAGDYVISNTPVQAATPAPAPEARPAKQKKAERPTRGIETMFRVASANHQRLSDMADSKANIMISVNSIILSVVLGLMARRLETNSNLIIPTLMLLSGSVAAVIFSVLATRPKIPGGSFAPEQLQNKSVNLLFFGNFYKMDFEHYYDGMKRVMNDGDFLYASLIRDIHSQGIVLGHKYKLLRISYTIFMFTLIVSVLAFGIAIIFFG